MLKLWSMKKEQDSQVGTVKKTSAAHLRIMKDFTELDLPESIQLHVDDPVKLLDNLEGDDIVFKATIKPDEGIYEGGSFDFTFNVKNQYPHAAPKVLCKQKIYHPNIDTQGNICLNILREDWKPVLNLQAIFVGLLYLFLEPNPSDPLNKEAAEDLRRDRGRFGRNVKLSMRGGEIAGKSYDRVI